MILLAIILILIIIIYYPIIIEVKFSTQSGKKTVFAAYWRPLGNKLKLRIPLIRKKNLNFNTIPWQKFKKAKQKKSKFYLKISQLIMAIKIQKLSLDVVVGTEDAAQTALLSGGINIVLGILFPVLSSKFPVFEEFPTWHVYPSFKQSQINLKSLCILESTCGDIIFNGLKSITRKKEE